MRHVLLVLSGLGLLASLITPAQAQFSERSAEAEGTKLGKEFTTQWRIGVSIKAQGGQCNGMVGTVPVPLDWPEQRVRIIDEKMTPNVRRVSYRELQGGAKQMIVDVPRLLEGEEAIATVTFEVTRNWQLPPENVAQFKAPTKMKREINMYLMPSPYIESTNGKIVKLAKETTGKKEGWAKVEAIYDTAREKVQYKEGELKGALRALTDGNGDCEEISSLFIAMCRASKIPARMVWVPGHCYPEFYLEDGAGKG